MVDKSIRPQNTCYFPSRLCDLIVAIYLRPGHDKKCLGGVITLQKALIYEISAKWTLYTA